MATSTKMHRSKYRQPVSSEKSKQTKQSRYKCTLTVPQLKQIEMSMTLGYIGVCQMSGRYSCASLVLDLLI